MQTGIETAPRTPNIGTLTDTLIECVSLEKTEPFYTETLGLEVKARGDTWTVLDGGQGAIVLWQGEKSEVVIGFTRADLLAVREAMEARGADPGPIDAHPSGEFFYLTDPEGNTIMIST